MVSWQQVIESAPEFGARVRAVLDAHKHKTIATLRADGGPRISGTELTILDGELYLGSMVGARKGADLRRDPRFALHSASVDPPEDDPSGWAGDAKLSGLAVHLADPAQAAALLARMGAPPEDTTTADVFRLDVSDVVLTRVGDPADHLLIEHWTPAHALRSHQRY